MRLGKTPRQLPVFAGGVSGANSARLGTKSIPRLRGWSGRRELNPRPTAWKAETLPLSYSRPGKGDVLMCPSEILLPFIPTPLQQIGSETLIAGRLRVHPPATQPRAQRIERGRAKRTGRSGTTLSYWNSMLVNQLPAGAP